MGNLVLMTMEGIVALLLTTAFSGAFVWRLIAEEGSEGGGSVAEAAVAGEAPIEEHTSALSRVRSGLGALLLAVFVTAAGVAIAAGAFFGLSWVLGRLTAAFGGL